MQKNKKGATTKISLYHTWFSTFAKIILQINLVAKTVKAHVCSATNSEPLSRKLKLSQISITTVAGNTSTAFLASLFKASASLFIHFSGKFHLLLETAQKQQALLLLSVSQQLQMQLFIWSQKKF